MKRISLLLVLTALAACTPKPSQTPPEVVCDGGERFRFTVVSPEIVRVTEVPSGEIRDRESLIVVPQEGSVSYQTATTDSTFVLTTDAIRVVLDKRSATVSFYRTDDNTLLAGGARASFAPFEQDGEAFWSPTLRIPSPDDEAFYGLGQHQAGEFNHKGGNEDLFQYNTKISTPMVVSTRGYGILFDAYSLGRWGNPEPYRQLDEIFDLRLTGTYTAKDGTRLVRCEDSLYYENEWAIRNLPEGFPLSGAKVVYEGSLTAPESGDYDFIQYYAGFQRTWLDGVEVMTRRWRPAWNPSSYKFTCHLEEGREVPLRIEWDPDGDVSYIGLRVKPLNDAQRDFCYWSECEPSLDYYFIAGDRYDDIIRGYRQLTGAASLIPKWALGFWQSRERYSTQEDLVGTLAEMRRRHIPVDNIVQDWQYWKDDQWGSHEFDGKRYPDPEQMLDDVHALHGRFMISVWPKFYTTTDHYRELRVAGYTYTNTDSVSLKDWLGHRQTFYDAYAAGGRAMFWRQMDESLYSKYGRKIDAWWMDASEPNLRDCLPLDYVKFLTTPNALGSSTEYLNAYALVNAMAIYEGQRSVDPDKRVFLLTRNGFAGLQRYSTASWSGDIGTSWTDMRMQMDAGLGYSMSGLPWWGMDIGGFSVMSKFYDPANTDEWQELQTRWHQFGCFVPLFRAHGQWPRRELWNIAPEGSPAYESILWYMRLRYRLMPYIYSVAADVAFNGGTMMRGLPMDFPDDPDVRCISSQWLFGPALMPCPVSEYKARSRSVYFPSATWYDFYTGACVADVTGSSAGEDSAGLRSHSSLRPLPSSSSSSLRDNSLPTGPSPCPCPGVDRPAESSPVSAPRRVSVSAPYERIPLFVKGGSIIPIGPEVEWTDAVAAEDILLLVYAGADADFTLYEDDGTSYGYERGECSRIPLHWDDAARTLTIGARSGSWPGMPEERRFRVCLIDPSHPVPYDPDAEGMTSVSYNGELLTILLQYE